MAPTPLGVSIAAAIASLVLLLWRGAVTSIATTLGVSYGPTVLFAVGALFVLVVLLHYSTVISALTDRTVALSQQLAILEERLRRLETDQSGDK